MMKSSTMSVRLDQEVKRRLEKLAEATHRSKSFLAAEAIGEYVNLQEWQLGEIQKGVAEADANQVLTHDDVLSKWEKKCADQVDDWSE